MSGHTSWSSLRDKYKARPDADKMGRVAQRAWVRGYILALEDLDRDWLQIMENRVAGELNFEALLIQFHERLVQAHRSSTETLKMMMEDRPDVDS